MKVVVLYQDSGEDATVEDRDVQVQRDAVAEALTRLGHQVSCLHCTLDLASAKQHLMALEPDAVFNLVESLGGTDRLMVLATILLDALQVPYTGAQTGAILSTTNKLTAKHRLREVGLPTPEWLPNGSKPMVAFGSTKGALVRKDGNHPRWILKPVWEHASFSMDDDAVVAVPSRSALERRLSDRQRTIGRPLFAERFIEGREFNLSLLRGQVLPPGEIDFSSFPPDKPRIVGHQAKSDQNSFEYRQTPRHFDFPAADAALLERLGDLAVKCWELFDLSGCARVDFRVDGEGEPWILEVNANPCLSPDAGFAAALSQAGITYDEAIRSVVDCSRGWTCEQVESSESAERTTSEGRLRSRSPRIRR